MANTKSILCNLATSIFCLFTTAASAMQSAKEAEELLFRVLLNDKEIGFHSFKIAAEAERQTVDINADFDVTIFAIPVYSYDHSNREIWNKGCLEKIASHTDDNGDEYSVDGQLVGNSFKISTRNYQIELENNCVMTFAYWNKNFLHHSHLLNSQTGEYLPVEINFKGIEQLQLGSKKVSSQRYNIRNDVQGIDITVWYDARSNKWLSLESRVDGRVIRYLPAEYKVAAKFIQALASSVEIRGIESLLNVQLVDRTNRNVTINAVGREVAAQARLVLKDMEVLIEVAQGNRSPLSVKLEWG